MTAKSCKRFGFVECDPANGCVRGTHEATLYVVPINLLPRKQRGFQIHTAIGKPPHSTIRMERQAQQVEETGSVGLYEQCALQLGDGASSDDMLQCFSTQILQMQTNNNSPVVVDAFSREVLLVLA